MANYCSRSYTMNRLYYFAIGSNLLISLDLRAYMIELLVSARTSNQLWKVKASTTGEPIFAGSTENHITLVPIRTGTKKLQWDYVKIIFNPGPSPDKACQGAEDL